MSKKRGRPSKADKTPKKTDAPQDEKPQAAKADTKARADETPKQPKPLKDVPEVPKAVAVLAQIPRKRWGTPAWLTVLACYTGSRFGKEIPARNNMLGIRAEGTEPHNGKGVAWYGNVKLCYNRFGWICNQLELDYSKPKDCIAKLKSRCPEIDTIPHDTFMEA